MAIARTVLMVLLWAIVTYGLTACSKDAESDSSYASRPVEGIPIGVPENAISDSPKHEAGTGNGSSPNAIYLQSSNGGILIGGSPNGSLVPSSEVGIVTGSNGGIVIGGPFNGSYIPGREGGVVIGGPLNGSYMPGSTGGIVIGGPLNGTYVPSRE